VISLRRRDPRLDAIVGVDPRAEVLGTGFIFTEGPVWHATGGFLLFSDMPGDHLRRYSDADGISTFRKPCHKSNGLAYDHQGRLLVCEHATSRLTRTEADGSTTTLASHYQGRALNSPNDLVVRSDGAIYFSDPIYGRMDHYGVKRDPELPFRGVYRIDPGGGLNLLADDFEQPNGLCFSADERRLFVNDTARGHIRVFDVAADGTVSGGRVWATLTGDEPGAPDGMKMDASGNLYCCGPGGIHILAPDATCLGVLGLPEGVANFCWGDSDLRSLYVAATTSLYRVRMRQPGRPLP
jgi:gluconolactonase